MSKQKKDDQQKVKNLQDAIERKQGQEGFNFSKIYILDEENAIVLGGKYNYNVMINYSMCYGKLFEVTHVPMRNMHGRQLKKYKLFMLMKDYKDNCCACIYDYEHGKFIVKRDTFDNIGYDASMNIIDQYTSHIDYLKRYNCFLAYFTLKSSLSGMAYDEIEYTSLINGQRYWYNFEPPRETYYAFVNLDGTIRGNSLFKGEKLTKIE